MSGWSRTTKPSADKTIDADTIYGVDRNEIAVTPIPSHVGWVKRTTVGSRVKTEVLVAMKTPPVEDNADDTVFPDTIITIGTHPASVSKTEGQTATFTVAATASPTATLTYQWQKQEGGAGAWSNISGATSTSYTTGALTVAADNGDKYRVVVTGTNTGETETSNAATLTVTA